MRPIKKFDARRRGSCEKNSGKKKWNNIIYTKAQFEKRIKEKKKGIKK